MDLSENETLIWVNSKIVNLVALATCGKKVASFFVNDAFRNNSKWASIKCDATKMRKCDTRERFR